jgi:hypothetical protein
MKSAVCNLSIVLAALVAAPATWAEAEIVKCVAQDGHVTLTDQPCPAGSTVSRLESGMSGSSGSSGSTGSGSGTGTGTGTAPAVEHYPAPRAMPRAPARTPAGKKAEPHRVSSLTRDVATLKEAHAQLLLLDAANRPRLAAN